MREREVPPAPPPRPWTCPDCGNYFVGIDRHDCPKSGRIFLRSLGGGWIVDNPDAPKQGRD